MAKLEAPQAKIKTDGILYAKVKPVNKKWLQKAAKNTGHTVASYVDGLIDKLRANSVSRKSRKSPRRNP